VGEGLTLLETETVVEWVAVNEAVKLGVAETEGVTDELCETVTEGEDE